MKNTEREERIREEINYIIGGAKKDRQNTRYYLEKLPMIGDYDEKVHEYLNIMESSIKKGDDEFLDFLVDDMVNYYMVSWEDYEEQF